MTTLLSIDFDGVLHDMHVAYSVDDTSLPLAKLLAAGLFAHAQVLEDLLASVEAGEHIEPIQIVVHSTWRLACTPERIRELLGPLGHRMRGVTPRATTAREQSILANMRSWRVILDDQPKLFRELRDQVVACPSTAGVAAVIHELDAALRRATA